MLAPISYNYNQPIFNANLASPRLKFSQHDFFIKIKLSLWKNKSYNYGKQ